VTEDHPSLFVGQFRTKS